MSAAEEGPVLVLLAAGQARRYGGCKPLAPLGLHGEAVIDLTAGDGVAAGFAQVVLVLSPATGPAIEYHVRRTWPAEVDVAVAVQPVALGTAHAVCCARPLVGDRPFAVVNGDDVYGRPAFEVLARHLADGDPAEHALVTFALRDSVVGGNPVTRGTVRAGGDGMLAGIDERRRVQAQPDGRFTVDDGRQPSVLAAATPVSVNLWGFRSSIWPTLVEAVDAAHPGVLERGADVSAAAAGGAPSGVDGGEEVLLPEVVGSMVAAGGDRVRVLAGPGRCVGVTHADDLPVVRRVLASMVGVGERPEWPWTGVA